ncbi:MAG: hypothetical protein NC324_08855 [Bacteroides sp.]|nr:hypothetical protein [Bacteroides sp.]
MKKLCSLLITVASIVLMLSCFSTLSAQTKTIHVIPETALIYLNGEEVGNGTYTIKFKRSDEFVMLKFTAPGYIDRTVKLFRTNPKTTLSYRLEEDEAERLSMGAIDGVDIANKFFTVNCKAGMSEEIIWKRLMNIAVKNFENVEVRDKAAGWIKTAWVPTRFASQVVRTRLEIQLQFSGDDELSYKVKLLSEIAPGDCGGHEECFSKYDRILRKYEQVITELQTSLGSNL